jgi:hypothetical protein
MKLFKCQACGQMLYFENSSCERCSHQVGFLPQINQVSALEPQGNSFMALAIPGDGFRFCANHEFDVCNWLIDDASTEIYCACCRHNRVIPDLSVPGNLAAWRKLEAAKHRLFYTLMKLWLPLENRNDAPAYGLMFDFLSAAPSTNGPGVLTGHDNGLITVAVEEADDVEREKRRTALHEPYRTLLGHFRHEVGHYYWDRLVRDGGKLDATRQVFGDERADYGEALKAHYANGAPANWYESFVTPYAAAHPWEDFAETWTHYLHIVDTIEMARAFGLQVNPRLDDAGNLEAKVDIDPYSAADFDRVIDIWMPLSVALNSLNRSMGQPDIYPFVLSGPVITKLKFIHDLILHAQHAAKAVPPLPEMLAKAS